MKLSKISIAFLASSFMSIASFAQVGIGTTSPSAGSSLDIDTSDKGFLVPRVSISDLATIAPVTGGSTEGLLVYNTNTSTGKGFYYWDGSAWVGVQRGVSGTSVSVAEDWKTEGNAGTDPGVGADQHFVGTTDAKDFIIATNSAEAIRVSSTGIVSINTASAAEGAIMDISSANKGLMVPKVQITNLSTIAPVTGVTATPAAETAIEGLLVYNTESATGKGFHYWNGTDWVAVQKTDGDFYKVGTTTAPESITDDVYRTGKVAIGKTTPNSALDITDNSSANAVNFDSTGSDNVLNVKRSGSKSGTARGIYVDYVNSDTGSTTQYAVATYVRGGSGTGNRYGVYNNVQDHSSGSNSIYGTYNGLTSNNGTGGHIGSYNRLGGNTARAKTGVNNYITGTDNGVHIGIATNLSGTGTGNHIGVQNIVRGNGYLRGIYNTFNDLSGDDENIGMETQNTNDGNGIHKGVHTRLDGNGTGEKIGSTNYITSQGGDHIGTNNVLKRDGSQTGTTGTGDKIGTYNNITNSEGDNYGVYNYLTQTVSGKTSYGSYNHVESDNGTNIAGYFTANGAGTNYAAIFDEGNVGIGTDAPDEKLVVNGKIKATDINFSNIPSYPNNSTANADASLQSGDVYRVNNNLRIKL